MTRVLVELPEWMVVSENAPLPVVGAVQQFGLVAFSDDFGAHHDGLEALVQREIESPSARGTNRYRIAATVLDVVDVDVTGDTDVQYDAGCELFVSVQGHRMLIRLRGQADTWTAGDRVLVEGDLSVLATYEYGSFDLPDVRSDWRIISTERHGGRDYVIELESVEMRQDT